MKEKEKGRVERRKKEGGSYVEVKEKGRGKRHECGRKQKEKVNKGKRITRE